MAFGQDRDRWCGEIREDINGHVPRRPRAGSKQENRQRDDDPVMVDGPVNQACHQCTCPSAGRPLAAEASWTSYAPLVTTRSPCLTPLRTPTRLPSRVATSTYRRAKLSPPVCTKTYGRPASINTASFGTAG